MSDGKPPEKNAAELSDCAEPQTNGEKIYFPGSVTPAEVASVIWKLVQARKPK